MENQEIVMRFYEPYGLSNIEVTISTQLHIKDIFECNLLEDNKIKSLKDKLNYKNS